MVAIFVAMSSAAPLPVQSMRSGEAVISEMLSAWKRTGESENAFAGRLSIVRDIGGKKVEMLVEIKRLGTQLQLIELTDDKGVRQVFCFNEQYAFRLESGDDWNVVDMGPLEGRREMYLNSIFKATFGILRAPGTVLGIPLDHLVASKGFTTESIEKSPESPSSLALTFSYIPEGEAPTESLLPEGTPLPEIRGRFVVDEMEDYRLLGFSASGIFSGLKPIESNARFEYSSGQAETGDTWILPSSVIVTDNNPNFDIGKAVISAELLEVATDGLSQEDFEMQAYGLPNPEFSETRSNGLFWVFVFGTLICLAGLFIIRKFATR